MTLILDGSSLTIEKLVAIARNRNIRSFQASDVLFVWSRLNYLVGSTMRLSRYKVS